jgi:small subunit ribosomal protein S16
MVVIRLTRDGRKKRPFHHIVVADKRIKRDSCIERIGYFDPLKKNLHINTERFQYWVQQGAHINPKSRVRQLFSQWTQQQNNLTITEVNQENGATA